MKELNHRLSYRKRRSPVTYEALTDIYFDANKIVALRKSFNMSQCEFSKAIGVTERAVAAWEMGTAAPSKPTQNLMHAFSLDKNLIFQFIRVVKKENAPKGKNTNA